MNYRGALRTRPDTAETPSVVKLALTGGHNAKRLERDRSDAEKSCAP